MRNLFFLLGFVLMGILSYSCSEDYEPVMTDNPKDAADKPRCITPEQAAENVLAFLDAIDEAQYGKSRTNVKRRISDISPLTRPVYSRFRNPPQGGSDTLLYIINFADSAGFAIAGATPNGEPVYAIVNSGNYSLQMLNTETNKGFTMFLKFTMRNLLDEELYGSLPPTQQPDTVIDDWKIYKIIEPKLITNWGQGGMNNPNSYGKYCPNKTAGCGIIAAAQVLSYFKTPDSVSWSENGVNYYSDIVWTKILLDASIFNGKLDPIKTPRPMDQIAHLCRYLGLEFNADYRDYYDEENQKRVIETSTTLENVVKWFNKKSALNATNIKSLNINEKDIANAIYNDKLVIARGQTASKEGHSWVIDGVIEAKKNGKKRYLFSCNWGWNGDKNGYYLADSFNTLEGAEISTYPIDSISGNNYNLGYKLKYTIISK